jgi:hypothetical protein
VTRDLQFYSNIIFSNGELDPWMAGGVTDFVNNQLPSFVIKGGAHHLDLRLPNDVDKGTDVEWVRAQESKLIESWIRAYQGLPPSLRDEVAIEFPQY